MLNAVLDQAVGATAIPALDNTGAKKPAVFGS